MDNIEQLLNDFYTKYTDVKLDSTRLSNIKSAYGNNYDTMVKDLYNKYNQPLDDKKLATIKSAYKLEEINIDNNTNSKINSYLGALESNNDYTAKNPNTSATGKYQHMWSKHKGTIAKLTGITSQEEYLKNPNAQEKVQQHFNTEYLNELPELRQIASQNDLNLSDEELVYLRHHSGLGGARRYLSGRYVSDHAGLENRLLYGRQKGFTTPTQTKNSQQESQINLADSPVQELNAESKDVADKKVKEQYSKLGFWDKFTTTVGRKGITSLFSDLYSSITEGDASKMDATKATNSEIMAAKQDLLNTPKYKNLWNTVDDVEKLLQGTNYKTHEEHKAVADMLEKRRKEDAAEDWGLLDGLDGQYYKTENGKELVNLKPFVGGFIGTAEDVWVPVENVKTMTTHPSIDGSKTTFQKNILNEKLNSAQADIAKRERYIKENIVDRDNNFVSVLGVRIKNTEKELETKYPKNKEGKMEVDPNDPVFMQYQKDVDNYNAKLDNMKQYEPDTKIALLFDQNKKARVRALESDYKNLNGYEKAGNELATLVSRGIRKLYNVPRSAGQFAGSLVDTAFDTNIATDSQISDAYDDNEIKRTSSQKSVRKIFKLPDDRKLEYKPDGSLGGLLDNNNNTLDASNDDLQKLAKDNNASYDKSKYEVGWDGVLSGIEDLITDLPIMMIGSNAMAKALQEFAKTGIAAKFAGLGRTANVLAESERMHSFVGAYSGFYDKITEGAIREGGLTTGREIGVAGTLKTSLEAVVEMINPIEGKILSGKIWDNLSTAQIKNFTKRILNGEATHEVIKDLVKQSAGAFSKQSLKAIGAGVVDTAVSGIGESLEEVVSAVFEPGMVNKILNNWLDTTYNTNANLQEISEGALVGFAGGFLLGGFSNVLPSAASLLKLTGGTRDAVLNNSIRASLQHRDLFSSNLKNLFENKKVEVSEQYVSDPQKLEESLNALEKGYNRVAQVHKDALGIVDSRGVFKESTADGFVPSSILQTKYSDLAFKKAIIDKIDDNDLEGIDVEKEKVNNFLDTLDVFRKNRFDGYVDIESINAALPKGDNLNDKMLNELSSTLRDGIQSEINTLSKKRVRESYKLATIEAYVAKEISQLKNGTASESLQTKYNEAKTRLEEEEKKQKEKEKEIKEKLILNTSYSDFIKNRELSAKEIADKHNLSETEADDILTKVKLRHGDIKLKKYKDEYNKRIKQLTNNPDILTEDDIQSIINHMGINTDPNLNSDDLDEINNTLIEKFNDASNPEMVKAMENTREFAAENLFKKVVTDGGLPMQNIGVGRTLLGKIEGQNDFRVLNPGKGFGKKASRKQHILATAATINAVTEFGNSPLLISTKVGKNVVAYTYDIEENKWKKLLFDEQLGTAYETINPKPKYEKKLTNVLQKNFDELHAAGLIDFTGQELIDAINDSIVRTPLTPSGKDADGSKGGDNADTVEKEYIDDKLNDALSDASLDPNLEENKHYNSIRVMDFTIAAINAESLLYEEHKNDPVVQEIKAILDSESTEIIDENPRHQVYKILTDVNKNSEFINTIYNFIITSQDNAEAKFNWTNSIAKNNSLNTPLELKEWFNNNTEVNYNIDLDYIKIHFNSKDAKIIDGKLISFNEKLIGQLPVNLIYTDKTTGTKYFSFMHDDGYYVRQSRFDNNANSVDRVTPEEYSEQRTSLLKASGLSKILFDNYILNNELDKFLPSIKNEISSFIKDYYVKTHSGKNLLHTTVDDFQNIITELKSEIYSNKDNLETITSNIFNLSPGHFEYNTDETTTRVSELTSSKGNVISNIRIIKKEDDAKGTPGSVIGLVTSPNLTSLQFFLTSDPYSTEEIEALSNNIKSFLTSDIAEREQIRKLVKMFVYGNDRGDNYIKLITDTTEKNKPFIKVKINGKEIELNTNPDNKVNENIDNILKAYFQNNPNKHISNIFLDSTLEPWNSTIPKLTLDKKVLFDPTNYSSYKEYVKTITTTDIKSLDIYQSNIKYRVNSDNKEKETKDVIDLESSKPISIFTIDDIDDAQFSTVTLGNFKTVSNNIVEGDIQWINEILPQLGLEKSKIDKLTDDVEVLGAFVSSLEILDDFGANYGIYYTNKTKLTSNRTQIRHEAFEAIWALYMSENEKKLLLNAAKLKYNAPSKMDLEILSKTYPGLTNKELIDKWYKEELADQFNEYEYKEPTNIIERFFNKLKDLINNILGRKDVINALFNNINAGKYKNKAINKAFLKNSKEYSSVSNNYVTEETARKIGKALAAKMLSAYNNNTKLYAFVDMDAITHNDTPIVEENIYNSNYIANFYGAHAKKYIKTLENPVEKQMYTDIANLHLKDFQTDKLIYKATIVEFNKLLKIKNKNPENEVDDLYNNNEEQSDNKTGKEYDIASFETDYKANQYPVIKLLLSSIMNPDGTKVEGDAPIIDMVPYEVMNNLLVLLFANNYAGSSDINSMITDIKNFTKYRPEFEQIYTKLEEWKEKGLTHLLNQFANSFTFEKLNFINVLNNKEVDSTFGDPEIPFEDQSVSIEKTSIIQQISKDPVDTLEDRWERMISNQFVYYDTTKTPIKQAINFKEAIKKLEKITELINNSAKFNRAFRNTADNDLFLESVGLGLQDIFKELGININSKTANIYFEKYGTGDNQADLRKLIQALNSVVLDTAKVGDDRKRDLTTFINSSKNAVFEDTFGELKFQLNENVIRNIIRSQLIFEDQILENTILSGSVRKWVYGLPSFLSQQILELRTNKEYLNSLSSRIFHKRSVILNAMKNGFVPELSDVDNLSSEGNDYNLNEPKLVDDIYASIQYTLNTKRVVSATSHNVRLLSFNSHKRNNVNISIPSFYSFSPEKTADNNATIKVFRGYFLDEYERILLAINTDNGYFDKYKNLKKNSFNSNLFSELSYNYKDKISDEAKALQKLLYNKNNLNISTNTFLNNEGIRDALDNYIENKLKEVVEHQKNFFKEITDNNLELLFPKNILRKYDTTVERAIDNAIGDFTVMGIIGSIEHTKVFIGDPAQYKNKIDLTKRTHSTTSSGMQYTLPFDNNYIVIKTDKKVSEYYNDDYTKNILFDVRKKEWQTYLDSKQIEEIPSDKYIKDEVEVIYKEVKNIDTEGEPASRAYGDVNDTDAFAEVNLPMWKEMLIAIGRWNSKIHDPIYDKLLKGGASTEDMIYSGKKGITDILSTLQPVKSVQFATSLLNDELLALSTYHKWALVPSHPGSFTNGSERQKRYNLGVYGKLEVDYAKDIPLPIERQVHFTLYDSATKGTNNIEKYLPSVLNTDNFDIESSWNNNMQMIPAWTMKLQNDLSAKFYKKTKVQEGSQFRKNVFQNIHYDQMYTIPESDEQKNGEELLSEMQDIDSTISNKKLNKFIKDTDYNEKDGIVGDPKRFTQFILDELERRTPTDNLLSYLKNNEFNINLLPQFKSLFENIYSSINRNKIIKSEVTGGSFIQLPETGLTGRHLLDSTVDQNYTEGDKIILLDGFSIGKNGKLKGPTLEKNDDKLSYNPTLIFLPHHLLRALPKNKRTAAHLNELFKDNPKLLRGLGYRIPNQGASSIDSFQIAGILPDYMGDSMVVYQDITTKYGSDYDIDKMYVSLYNFKFDGKVLKTVPYYTNPTDEQNKELYEARISEMLKENKEYKEVLLKLKTEINGTSKLTEHIKTADDDILEDNLKKELIDQMYDYLNDTTDDSVKDLEDSLVSFYVDIDLLKETKEKLLKLTENKKEIIENLRSGFPITKFDELTIHEKHSDKALQNRKMDINRAIVESELFHFENIAPLDKWVEPIKEAIKEMYNMEKGDNNDPVEYGNDLVFWTTSEQLRIKNINNNAKKALGIAANSGVALPFQRQANMKYSIKLGNKFNEIDFTKLFDIENRAISQRISAGYLSAFVDADKDPYIIFANINTFTYPIVDMLIKARLTEKQIIQFMAQPIIKDVLFKQNFESSLFDIEYKIKTATEKVADSVAEGDLSNFYINDFPALFDKYFWDVTPGSTMSNKLKNNVYQVNVKKKENQLSNKENLEILYLFNQLRLHASNISEAITSAKYDVSAGGATFNEALTKYEATRKSMGITINEMQNFVNALKDNTITDKLINDINLVSPVTNYVNLFVKKEDNTYKPTSQGTYFLNSAVLLKDFSKGDNITQHPIVSKAIYDIHSILGKNYITDPKAVTKIKNSAYTFLINRALMSKPLEINGRKYNITGKLVEGLFKIENSSKDNKTFLTRIFSDEFREIAPTLVDVLIPKKIFKSNKSLSFVRGDNFKTSDVTIKNQIIKEVEAIIENDRKRNTNPSTKNEARNDSLGLLLYSFYSSGFTFDSSSFFDLLPLELTEKLINVSDIYSHLEKFDEDFITQFFKSNYHDSDFVQALEKNPYKPTMGVAVVNAGGRMITGISSDLQHTYKPYISHYNKDKKDYDFYEFRGIYTEMKDGIEKIKLVYAPVQKLGYKAGRFKITELGTTEESWLNVNPTTKVKGLPKTFQEINNTPKYEYIKDVNKIDSNSTNKSVVKTIPLQKNKEIEVGGTVIMDSSFDAGRSWNTSGEAIVQEQLGEPTGQTSKGYNYWGNNPEGNTSTQNAPEGLLPIDRSSKKCKE